MTEQIEILSDEEIEQWRHDLAHVVQPERHSLRALATIDAWKRGNDTTARLWKNEMEIDRREYGAEIATLKARIDSLRSALSEVTEERDRLREEIAVADKLLAERNRVFYALPCPMHGPCVPYVLQRLTELPPTNTTHTEEEE